MRHNVEVHEHHRDSVAPATDPGSSGSWRARLGLVGRSVIGLLGLTMVLLLLSALVIAALVLAFNWLVFGMVLGGLGE